MTGKEYTIVDSIVFNGARDTDGGIWVRLDDDDDHRILSAAVTKQIKNTEAAKGTLSALDPNAPHLLDDILASLNRVLGSVNGARPASAQLTGTPIGDAIAGEIGADGKKKRGRKKAVTGYSPAAGAHTEEIQWAENIPEPRPRVGTAFWPALGFASAVPLYATGIVGYDEENAQFVVETVDAGRSSIVYNAAWGEWIGAGAQPNDPSHPDVDMAAAAVKELIAALRSGYSPAALEDSQFESVAKVATTLLATIARANDRTSEMRTVAEFIDEYRTLAENAFELAGGIEYDLGQATSLEPVAETGQAEYSIVDDEEDDDHTTEPPKRKPTIGRPKPKPAVKKGKSGGKRKR